MISLKLDPLIDVYARKGQKALQAAASGIPENGFGIPFGTNGPIFASIPSETVRPNQSI
jgi:hypothetical protein